MPPLAWTSVQPAAPAPRPSTVAATPSARRARRAYVVEGLRRSVILEQAKLQRAARHRDAAAWHESAARLDALYARLAEEQEIERQQRARSRADRPTLTDRLDLRARRERVASLIPPLPAREALASAFGFARAAPSKRLFNVTAILFLNGFLMMLMSALA